MPSSHLVFLHGDKLQLAKHIFGQPRYLYATPSGLVRREEGFVNLVESDEIVHVFEEDL